MHEIELIFGLLVAVAALAVIAEKIEVAYPILLVVGGLVLGFVPSLPHVELRPDVVFLIFPPPLLTSAAWYTSWRDFQANLRPILSLAIGLVLAAVAVGLYHHRYSSEAFAPNTQIRAIAVWELFVFLLNGLVFILIGLQLPQILEAIAERPVSTLAGYAISISAVVIGIRILWVFLAAHVIRWLDRRHLKQTPSLPWQNVMIVAWTGMRGVVSLAAALALPLTTNTEIPFPDRHLILFLTSCVILVTLVLQGLTLPLPIRRLKVVDDGNTEREEMEARLRAAEAAMARLEELIAENDALKESIMVQWLRTEYEERVRQYCDTCDAMDTGNYEQLAALKVLQRETVAAERKIVIGLRNRGVIDDEVLNRLEHELDLEAIWLKA